MDRKLTYAEIPNRFTSDGKEKQFNLRKREFTIGRTNYGHHILGQGYYMRVLMNVQRCPKSSQEF